jgi:copper homeostasis protein CutC/predicted N-acetyltransferase YhbS
VPPEPAFGERAVLSGLGRVFALFRRRGDTFRLGPAEVAGLLDDVGEGVRRGVGGVVVGVLDAAGRIDGVAMAELVAAAEGRPVTFHRAFDDVDDPVAGLDVLVRAGVKRVLTSGGPATAWEGRAVLRRLVDASTPGFTVLGGGKVRGDHVRRLADETGLTEVHARAVAVPGLVQALRGGVGQPETPRALGVVRFDAVDPGDAHARHCLDRYYSELGERFDAGFDAALSIQASAEVFRPPAGIFLVGTDDGRPIACGAVKVLEGGVGYVKRMWVDGDMRGKGIGRRLLAALEDAAVGLGCDVIELETNRSLKEAQALYRTAGYEEVPAFNDEFYAHHWFRKRLRQPG